MTQARKTVVEPGQAGVFHVVSRCVRRAFLCGSDAFSGKSYEHRRGWIRDRIGQLTEVFGIEVFAYSVMANHFHLVLRTCPELPADWSAEEVVNRWLKLFPKERDESGSPLPLEETAFRRLCEDEAKVKLWRERLGDLSWFMRCLNENIARRANREDECTGRFWEGRFKCQRLEDEGAVLACMAYVDLNPVRAGLAETPEASAFTSAFDRIAARRGERVDARQKAASESEPEPTAAQQRLLDEAKAAAERAAWLAPVASIRAGGSAESPAWGITQDRYLELLDATGRLLKAEKGGRIDPGLAPILERLSLDEEKWVETVRRYGSLFYRVAGQAEKLKELAVKSGQKWFRRPVASQGVYRERVA